MCGLIPVWWSICLSKHSFQRNSLAQWGQLYCFFSTNTNNLLQFHCRIEPLVVFHGIPGWEFTRLKMGVNEDKFKRVLNSLILKTSISLTQWYPPAGKNFVVSKKDSWEDLSKCMCKLSDTNIHWCWRYSSGRTKFSNILSIWANKNGHKSAILN